MLHDFETLVDRRPQEASKWMSVSADADCVPLSVADMEFVLAPEIRQSMKEALDTYVFGYAGPNTRLKTAVVNWMEKRHGMKVDPEWLVFTPGVVTALFLSIRSYVQPGEEVLVLSPVYNPFRTSITGGGAVVVESELINDGGRYTIDFADVEKKLASPRCKAMIFCSPHNPVGRVWTAEEVEKIGRLCMDNGCVLISDEIHNDLILPGYTHHMMGKDNQAVLDNTVICTACTKTFNMAGVKTSNIIIANPELRQKFRDTMSMQHIDQPPLLNQIMAACAYETAESWVDDCLGVVEKNYLLVREHLEKHYPKCVISPLEGTYLMWVDCRGYCQDKEKLEAFLKEECRLFLNQGHTFGAPGTCFQRINLACPTAVLEKALARLDKAAGAKGIYIG